MEGNKMKQKFSVKEFLLIWFGTTILLCIMVTIAVFTFKIKKPNCEFLGD